MEINTFEVGLGAAMKRNVGRWRIEGVERDKGGEILRTCGIADCQYKSGVSTSMNRHKAAKHGIYVDWFSCEQDNCDYKAKHAGTLKQYKQSTNNIGVVWHNCDSCDYKAKTAGNLKVHKQWIHDVGSSSNRTPSKTKKKAINTGDSSEEEFDDDSSEEEFEEDLLDDDDSIEYAVDDSDNDE